MSFFSIALQGWKAGGSHGCNVTEKDYGEASTQRGEVHFGRAEEEAAGKKVVQEVFVQEVFVQEGGVVQEGVVK